MFQETQDADYLATVEGRVRGEYLTWCEQVIDMIDELAPKATGLSLNDIGCCAGQFYKSLKRRTLPIQYRGFDVEPSYLKIAAACFPELADSLFLLNVETDSLPSADISVSSATLEHLDEPFAAISKILGATKRFAILRTFLGSEHLEQWRLKPGAIRPYRIRQFQTDDFLEHVRKCGFEPEIRIDRYTDSAPLEIHQGIVRRQHVLICKKTS